MTPTYIKKKIKKLNFIIFKAKLEDQLLALLVKSSEVCSTYISASFNFNFATLPLRDIKKNASSPSPPQLCQILCYKLIDKSQQNYPKLVF